MKDRWMNVGYEDNELKPYKEPPLETDPRRIGKPFLLFYSRWCLSFLLTSILYAHLAITFERSGELCLDL